MGGREGGREGGRDSTVQWNLSNPDTNGAEEVSLLVRCPHFRGCKSGTWGGKRCPPFRSVLIERERFHYRYIFVSLLHHYAAPQGLG